MANLICQSSLHPKYFLHLGSLWKLTMPWIAASIRPLQVCSLPSIWTGIALSMRSEHFVLILNYLVVIWPPSSCSFLSYLSAGLLLLSICLSVCVFPFSLLLAARLCQSLAEFCPVLCQLSQGKGNLDSSCAANYRFA